VKTTTASTRGSTIITIKSLQAEYETRTLHGLCLSLLPLLASSRFAWFASLSTQSHPVQYEGLGSLPHHYLPTANFTYTISTENLSRWVRKVQSCQIIFGHRTNQHPWLILTGIPQWIPRIRGNRANSRDSSQQIALSVVNERQCSSKLFLMQSG